MAALDRASILQWLKKRVAELQRRVEQIEAKRKALDDELRSIQRELDAARILYETESGEAFSGEAPSKHRYDALSLADVCAEILADADGALHAEEIRRRVQMTGARSDSPLTSFIAALSRDKERFVRVRDGTYDLKSRHHERTKELIR